MIQCILTAWCASTTCWYA